MKRLPTFPMVVLIMLVTIPFIYYLFHDQTSQVNNQAPVVKTEQSVNGEGSTSDSEQEKQQNQQQQQSEQSQENQGNQQQQQSEQSQENQGDQQQQQSEQSQENHENQEQQQENANDGPQVVWGVDSASYTDESMYQCVKENFGQPTIWGRYLGTKEDVSVGLDQKEVQLLHENDVRILVIYNHFNDARGYEHGVEEAKQAISMADELGIPKSVGLFGDIEPSYPVDADFIQGWYDTIAESKYEVGLYGVFDEGSQLISAFHDTSQQVQENTIVWTAYPQEELTTKENAPKFNPQGPEDSMLYGWQYAIEAEQCNIDTNLFRSEITDYLW